MVIGVIQVAHGGSVVLTNKGASVGHLGFIQIISSAVIKIDMKEVMPAWAERKAMYRALKVTEEVSLGISCFSGR